ncbi:hypothetical protein CONLIGDRAFT_687677 [Coniochaeta ligniaria NRRL 30616]|uniref:Uncharacterized protein n=1 Tax=Coniochaeta ligniaria NRRL 30616 TaxID=1408157 RepID=A0A1J7I485_9PEZI|nr:hypothetical protein CONLIGDRAFT_687677 [Coniochaeta ligniaria NRRL 30616]
MANQPSDQPDGHPSQSGQSDSQNSQNMGHPRPKKLGVNLTTIRYLDGSVTSLHAELDSLMEMMRTQRGQNQQLAAQSFQLPHRERPFREMTSHHEINPERPSFALFAPADRQQSAFPYNNQHLYMSVANCDMEEACQQSLMPSASDFGQDLAIASAKFTRGRLSLSDLADDLNQLTTFIQKKLRYARQIGILDDSTSQTGHAGYPRVLRV